MSNCKHTIENLYRYLDRDLSVEEMREVSEHLRRCPPCAKHFHFEEGVLRLVSEACRKQHAPEHLKAKILDMCQRDLAQHRP